jgi:hypothetical protein
MLDREWIMPMRTVLGALILVAATAAGATAGPPSLGKIDTSGLLPALAGGSPDALAGAIRGYLVKNLPDPIYESWHDWDHQKKNLRGKMKNDGRWKHVKVNILTPADTLVFDIRDLQNPEPGRITFAVVLSFDAHGEYDVQVWELGLRVRSSSIRARCRIRVALKCEATMRLESGDALLPEAVFRLRVVQSNLSYDHFVTEHIAGIGGDMADILGDAVRNGMKKWHPSLERDLLAKADASIEKAADTKEVRVGLVDLLKKKGWLPGTASPTAGPPAPVPAATPPPPPPPTPAPALPATPTPAPPSDAGPKWEPAGPVLPPPPG